MRVLENLRRMYNSFMEMMDFPSYAFAGAYDSNTSETRINPKSYNQNTDPLNPNLYFAGRQGRHRPMTRKNLLKLLKKKGGSMRKPGKSSRHDVVEKDGKTTAVPRHKDIKPGTVKAILDELDIDP